MYWLIISLFLFCVAVIYRPVAVTDLWGYLLYGDWMLKNGQIVYRDFYSYTATGARWINHEWLFQVVTAYLFNIGGFYLLSLILLGFVSVLVACLLYRQLVEGNFGLYGIIGGMLTVLSVQPGLVLRPQLVTYLFLILILFIFTRSKAGRSYWWVLPLLFLLWVNIHGAFVIGLGYLLAFSPLVLISQNGTQARISYGFCVLGCVLASFFNPYTYELWEMVIRTMTNPLTSRIIDEWQPVWEDPNRLLLWSGLTGLFMAWYMFKEEQEHRVLWAVPVLFATVVSLTSKRHVPVYGIMVGMICTMDRPRLLSKKIFKPGTVLKASLIVVCVISTTLIAGTFLRGFQSPPHYPYPEKALWPLRES
ncbi:MAG: hypothetical protein ABEJ65_01415, partial [bacterium]